MGGKPPCAESVTEDNVPCHREEQSHAHLPLAEVISGMALAHTYERESLFVPCRRHDIRQSSLLLGAVKRISRYSRQQRFALDRGVVATSHGMPHAGGEIAVQDTPQAMLECLCTRRIYV